MGSKYIFKCLNCGYNERVCGGKDDGFVAVVETMICQDCKKLVDVLIDIDKTSEHWDGVKDDSDFGKCPECRCIHVKKWDIEKKPCPKCGKKMKKTYEHVQHWD